MGRQARHAVGVPDHHARVGHLLALLEELAHGGRGDVDQALVGGVRFARELLLKARAQGRPRYKAAEAAGFGDKAVASLIALERNALTYAGHTVWNQRRKIRPTKEDPRKTMVWRPRADWVVSEKPTHQALIPRAQAERLLAEVDVDSPRRFRLKKPGESLLSGLMVAPDGTPWTLDGAYYRLSRKMPGAPRKKTAVRTKKRDIVDRLILERIARDIGGNEIAAAMVNEARRMAAGIQDDPRAIDEQIRRAAAQIDRLTGIVAETGNRSLTEKLERERDVLAAQRAECAEKSKLKQTLLKLTPRDITHLFKIWAYAGEDLIWGTSVSETRRNLDALIERIELDPATRMVQITYRVRVGQKLASPRGFEPLLLP